MAENGAAAAEPPRALELSIAIQNCNSLNLTTNVKSYELKIAAIKSFCTDIVFLCDTRLVSNKGVSGYNRLKTSLRDAKGRKYESLQIQQKIVGVLQFSKIQPLG